MGVSGKRARVDIYAVGNYATIPTATFAYIRLYRTGALAPTAVVGGASEATFLNENGVLTASGTMITYSGTTGAVATLTARGLTATIDSGRAEITGTSGTITARQGASVSVTGSLVDMTVSTSATISAAGTSLQCTASTRELYRANIRSDWELTNISCFLLYYRIQQHSSCEIRSGNHPG